MRVFPVLAGVLLMGSVALAQPGPGPDGGVPSAPPGAGDQGQPPPQQPQPARGGFRQKFEAANVTHDGHLTREQSEAAGMRGIVKRFDEIDVGKKGFITMEDVRAWHQARAAARPGAPAPQ